MLENDPQLVGRWDGLLFGHHIHQQKWWFNMFIQQESGLNCPQGERALYSLGNKRIHFFCGKKKLDTLAAVNIGYDKYPILETC